MRSLLFLLCLGLETIFELSSSTHAKCYEVTPMKYQWIGKNESELWFSPDCLRRELPFIEASFNSCCNNELDPDDRCGRLQGIPERQEESERRSPYLCARIVLELEENNAGYIGDLD